MNLTEEAPHSEKQLFSGSSGHFHRILVTVHWHPSLQHC